MADVEPLLGARAYERSAPAAADAVAFTGGLGIAAGVLLLTVDFYAHDHGRWPGIALFAVLVAVGYLALGAPATRDAPGGRHADRRRRSRRDRLVAPSARGPVRRRPTVPHPHDPGVGRVLARAPHAGAHDLRRRGVAAPVALDDRRGRGHRRVLGRADPVPARAHDVQPERAAHPGHDRRPRSEQLAVPDRAAVRPTATAPRATRSTTKPSPAATSRSSPTPAATRNRRGSGGQCAELQRRFRRRRRALRHQSARRSTASIVPADDRRGLERQVARDRARVVALRARRTSARCSLSTGGDGTASAPRSVVPGIPRAVHRHRSARQRRAPPVVRRPAHVRRRRRVRARRRLRRPALHRPGPAACSRRSASTSSRATSPTSRSRSTTSNRASRVRR